MTDLPRFDALPLSDRAALEQSLLKRKRSASGDRVIRRRETAAPSPVSFAQEALWFLDQLKPTSGLYNVFLALRLQGDLNTEALVQALNAIVRRHEVLRTVFPSADGAPVPVIAPELDVQLARIDLGEPAEEAREAEILRLANEEARRPFDLSKGPLLRTALLRISEAEHLLLITVHHIIFDGWSWGIFLRELAEGYAAFRHGEPVRWAELPIQYADYAAWQRERLQGALLEEQVGYWKGQLGSGPPILNLPVDHARPPVETHRGATATRDLSRGLTESLKRLSAGQSVTLFMTLLAAFEVLLHRYTGQDDILVGSPIAGRTNLQTEELIGMFVNTLVLRGDVSGDPSFVEVLRRTRGVALEAYAHQELPFEKLVKEIQPERDLSRSSLFQAFLAFENIPVGQTRLEGLTVSEVDVRPASAKFDLSLFVEEREGRLKCTLEYSTDLFEAGTMQRMLGHWETLLEGIAAKPGARVAELPLLTEEERRQQLVEWNATRVEYAGGACLHELFEEQVERTPDAVAIAFEDQELTYEELNGRANQLAHALEKLGAGPEVRVGICLERSVEMLVGLLGILKAGSAYVPLDPTYPGQRLEYMLADGGVTLLLTAEGLLGHFPAYAGRTLCIDRDQAQIGAQTREEMVSRTEPENLAYVLYTSGTTGAPKGVAIEHRSAVGFIAWAQRQFEPAELAAVVASTSISFDLSVFEIFVTLASGGKVLLVQNALEANRPWEKHQPTLLNMVPSAMKELVQGEGLPASVQVVNLAGEPTTGELVEAIYGSGTVRKVYDLYGPTEATTYSTCGLRKVKGPATIGQGIDNEKVYLLDANMQLAPVGVWGEVHIGGIGLARGYLNRPEITAEKFIPDPYSEDGGGRLYKTGDVARYLPDGNIEFLGRMDHQVKLRGFRIELGEIEAALSLHPGVQECVVIAREDVPGNKELVAYIVSNGTESVEGSELRRYVREKLPEYMVPGAYVRMGQLPMTPNGKVDRRALPVPERDRPESGEGTVGPRTPVEEILVEIWSEVLSLPRVGVDDNFFELGGHSLLATRLISRANNRFQTQLAVHSLFATPTIAGLGATIERELASGNLSPKTEITALPRETMRARRSSSGELTA